MKVHESHRESQRPARLGVLESPPVSEATIVESILTIALMAVMVLVAIC